MLGTRFAIKLILLELISLIEDTTRASLVLLVVVVNEVFSGRGDAWSCWKSVDVAFAEGFVSVASNDCILTKKKSKMMQCSLVNKTQAV